MIQDHMEVVDARGLHVGTVDSLEGNRIKLARDDSPDNRHHFVPTAFVASIGQKVHLSKTREQIQSQWTDI
jgi:hypothetical protein